MPCFSICYLPTLLRNVPIFVSKPEPMTLYVGKQALFQCSVTGTSPMEVVWHKDNIAISSEGSYLIKSEKNKYSLQITSLELSNQGVYLCKASNPLGTATFTTELRVVTKPSFVKTFEPVSAAVDEAVYLECQVDEDTGVSVIWTRDGRKVHQTMECKMSFEDKVAVFEIPKSKLKDSGIYICTATNEAGSSTCQAQVTVQGKVLQSYGCAFHVFMNRCTISWRPPTSWWYIVEPSRAAANTMSCFSLVFLSCTLLSW